MPDWIALEISGTDANGQTPISYNIRVNGEVRFGNIDLASDKLSEMETIGEIYHSLFEDRPTPARVKSAQLGAIGARLYRLWLEPYWPQIRWTARSSERRLLIVASELPSVLNLPWELLQIPGEAARPIGADTAWGVCRYPWATLPHDFALGDDAVSRQGSTKLRILFLASSPRGLPELDCEREEEFLLDAVASAASVEVEIGDLGTFRELQDRIASFKPHIVHLSGHGTKSDEGAAFFFESEAGDEDPRSARLLAATFRGSGVRCVFVSGCVSAVAPARNHLGGLCQSLVANGVPLAIGWAASIGDNVASAIAKSFYSLISADRAADLALTSARSFVWDGGPTFGDPSWSLPVLYASVPDTRISGELIDPQMVDNRPKSSTLKKPLPKMADGYARYLAGRRRELQVALPGLRDGTYTGVFITGLDGTGKSSLATRIVRRLEGDGRAGAKPIVITCQPGQPTSANELCDEIGLAFLAAKKANEADLVRNSNLPIKERLHMVIDGLNYIQFTLVLDAFDNNLDQTTRRFLNDDMRHFYEQMLGSLVGHSRVVMTSRFLPEGIKLPERFLELNLGELTENGYFQFLLRDPFVRKVYLAKRLTRRTLLDLRSRFGSSPKLVGEISKKLPTLDLSTLPEELLARARSRTALAGPALAVLEQVHADHCSQLKIDMSSRRLDETSLKLIQRAAVHAGALTPDAILKFGAGNSLQAVQDEIDRWRSSALAHVELGSQDKLWSIFGTLRGWFSGPGRMAESDWRAAHQAAAAFFLDVAAGLRDQDRHAELQMNRLDCLLAAREHYLAIAGSTQDSEPLLAASRILNNTLLRAHRHEEIIQMNQEILEFLEHPEPATWVAKGYLRRPDYPSARRWYAKAFDLCADGHPVEKGEALQGLAAVAWHSTKTEAGATEARRLLAQAMEIQQSNEDAKGQGLTIHQLGSIDFEQNRYDAARSQFEQALKLLDGTDAHIETQADWHQLGSIDFEERKYLSAKEKLNKALSMAQEQQDSKAEAAALHQLARVQAEEDINSQWLQKLITALKLRQQIGDGSGEAQSFRRIGELLLRAGKMDLALQYLAVSHYLYDTLGVGGRTLVAEILQREANASSLDAAELETLKADVQEAYLRDRGRIMMRRAAALLSDSKEADKR